MARTQEDAPIVSFFVKRYVLSIHVGGTSPDELLDALFGSLACTCGTRTAVRERAADTVLLPGPFKRENNALVFFLFPEQDDSSSWEAAFAHLRSDLFRFSNFQKVEHFFRRLKERMDKGWRSFQADCDTVQRGTARSGSNLSSCTRPWNERFQWACPSIRHATDDETMQVIDVRVREQLAREGGTGRVFSKQLEEDWASDPQKLMFVFASFRSYSRYAYWRIYQMYDVEERLERVSQAHAVAEDLDFELERDQELINALSESADFARDFDRYLGDPAEGPAPEFNSQGRRFRLRRRTIHGVPVPSLPTEKTIRKLVRSGTVDWVTDAVGDFSVHSNSPPLKFTDCPNFDVCPNVGCPFRHPPRDEVPEAPEDADDADADDDDDDDDSGVCDAGVPRVCAAWRGAGCRDKGCGDRHPLPKNKWSLKAIDLQQDNPDPTDWRGFWRSWVQLCKDFGLTRAVEHGAAAGLHSLPLRTLYLVAWMDGGRMCGTKAVLATLLLADPSGEVIPSLTTDVALWYMLINADESETRCVNDLMLADILELERSEWLCNGRRVNIGLRCLCGDNRMNSIAAGLGGGGSRADYRCPACAARVDHGFSVNEFLVPDRTLRDMFYLWRSGVVDSRNHAQVPSRPLLYDDRLRFAKELRFICASMHGLKHQMSLWTSQGKEAASQNTDPSLVDHAMMEAFSFTKMQWFSMERQVVSQSEVLTDLMAPEKKRHFESAFRALCLLSQIMHDTEFVRASIGYSIIASQMWYIVMLAHQNAVLGTVPETLYVHTLGGEHIARIMADFRVAMTDVDERLGEHMISQMGKESGSGKTFTAPFYAMIRVRAKREADRLMPGHMTPAVRSSTGRASRYRYKDFRPMLLCPGYASQAGCLGALLRLKKWGLGASLWVSGLDGHSDWTNLSVLDNPDRCTWAELAPSDNDQNAYEWEGIDHTNCPDVEALLRANSAASKRNTTSLRKAAAFLLGYSDFTELSVFVEANDRRSMNVVSKDLIRVIAALEVPGTGHFRFGRGDYQAKLFENFQSSDDWKSFVARVLDEAFSQAPVAGGVGDEFRAAALQAEAKRVANAQAAGENSMRDAAQRFAERKPYLFVGGRPEVPRSFDSEQIDCLCCCEEAFASQLHMETMLDVVRAEQLPDLQVVNSAQLRSGGLM